MGVLIEELVYPELFKDIRSCRLMSVFKHILTDSVFRIRRIKHSDTSQIFINRHGVILQKI